MNTQIQQYIKAFICCSFCLPRCQFVKPGVGPNRHTTGKAPNPRVTTYSFCKQVCFFIIKSLYFILSAATFCQSRGQFICQIMNFSL